MRLPLYHVDAFTDRLFGGNPAAVCPLDSWLPDDLLQRIAAENNLSETAYIVPSDAADHDFGIRWFTPVIEADLCGHATLAAAWVVQEHLGRNPETVRFQSRSGILGVKRVAEWLVLDFPARPAVPTDPVPALAVALGREPEEMLKAVDYLAVFGSERTVVELKPDMRALAELEVRGTIVTAPGGTCDFVSRFFAPRSGIDEDPVTGSAHCTLTPYWAQRLDKTDLKARQISARGGELQCRFAGDRVHIAGRAVTFLQGAIEV